MVPDMPYSNRTAVGVTAPGLVVLSFVHCSGFCVREFNSLPV